MGKLESGVNDLKTWCLDNGDLGQRLLKEWTGQCLDDGRQYSIDEVAKASHKRFTWKCSKNPSHIWGTTINARTTRKRGCPYCSGRNVTNKNSLKTWCLNNGDYGKQLLKEWTGQCLDDNKQYNPDEVTRASGKKFKWCCSKDTSHIWEAKVNDRTNNKTGCPYCSGTKVTGESSFKTWCLNNGDYGQQLLSEWTGICVDDNRQYSIDEITKTSHRKFRWRCSKDTSHIWEATLANRTSCKSGCQYCSGRNIQGKNSLKTWCLDNGNFGQQLLNEWTGQCLDDNRQYSIDEVTRASNRKFKWQCSKNPSHIWIARVAYRTRHNSGCPYCSVRKIQDEDSLKTWCLDNGSWGQQLINEWTGQCVDDNKQYTPDEVTKASNKRFNWQCSKDTSHIWEATVISRARYKTGCPYCLGTKVIDENSLKTWCSNNGDYGKQLLEEWTGKCLDDNKQYTPDEVAEASRKRFKWQCSKDTSHIWKATVVSRTEHKNCCPYCNYYDTSYPEQVLYHSIRQVYPKTINKGTYKGYEFDIAIPEIKTCIKYNGVFWHTEKIDRDNKKSALCKKHNVKFIQIYVHQGEVDSQDIFEPNFILYKVDIANQDEQIKNIVSMILNQFKHSIDEIDFPKACADAFESSRNNVKTGVNDLKTWCLNNGDFGEQLLEEWTGQCLDDNEKYTPDEVGRATSKKLKWQCSKNPSHIWAARIADRTIRKSGCPYCSGRRKIKVVKNNLKTWCLDNGIYGKQLLKEWTGQCLNDNKLYLPDEVARASGKKFRWQCSKNSSHIWDATVAVRTSHETICPYCSEKGLTGKNSLKDWCLNNGDYGKQLLEEWTGQCMSNNRQYTPDNILSVSKKVFKWQCSKDPSHTWNLKVIDRTSRKTGCPRCFRLTNKRGFRAWCLNHGSLGQQILNEWTGQCTDDNVQYSIEEVTRKVTKKKFKWRCSKNPLHTWEATLNARMASKADCPYCSEEKA